MATAPNLVVAGDPGVARSLRETGRFSAVYDAASAAELRDLSRSGRVGSPAAFMFAPGFVEDLPGAGVSVLANGLAGSGFTVLVHGFFAQRGEVFDPGVHVIGGQLKMSDLLALFGISGPAPAPQAAPPQTPRTQTPQAQAAPQAQAGPQAQAPSQTQAAPQAQAAGRQQPVVQPFAAGPPNAEPAAQAPAEQPPAADQASAGGWAPNPAQPPSFAQGPGAAPSAEPPAPTAPAPNQQGWPGQQAFTGRPAAGGTPAAPEAGEAARQDYSAMAAQPASNGWPPPQQAQAAPVRAQAPAPALGRVIAIASAKGGVGKTTTAVNMSLYAARHLKAAGRPGRVALVDTNFQQADVARYLNVESPTVLDMLRVNGSLRAESVRNHLAHLPEPDLFTLLGPQDVTMADPALINAMLYRRIITVLRQAFDFVFVDTPVAELYHMTFTDLILPEADAILVPVEPNRVTLEAARAWLGAITMARHSRSGGVDPEKLSLILNRARADVDCSPEDVMDLMPGWRFVGMIPEDQEWTQAANNRRLNALQIGPDLDATFREILQFVTGDPVFGQPLASQSASGRGGIWKRLLGMDPK
ncbi:AAA family ATPase [Actinomadura sp. DSM 109109]|nr:AAA family ATPase [Actinomadura lepetitiana]